MSEDLTPEMLAHIEMTRRQASHNYVSQKIEAKPKRRRVKSEEQDDISENVTLIEDADGDHSDSA